MCLMRQSLDCNKALPRDSATTLASLIFVKKLPGRDSYHFVADSHALGGDAMQQDGFPHNVVVWMGLAFAAALSLLTAFAFGGFPLP